MAYRKGGPTLAGISTHDSSGSDSPVEASAVLRWRLVGPDRGQARPRSPIGCGHPCEKTKEREKRMEVLGLTNGTLLLAALVLALYLLVIWMLLEIIFRADFSGPMKLAWIFVALLLAPVAVPIWFLWVRRKDYSRT